MDETYTRADERLAEFRVLLDLTAERLWDLQRDFAVLRDDMVKAYATLAALAALAALPGEQPPEDLWGDQTSELGRL